MKTCLVFRHEILKCFFFAVIISCLISTCSFCRAWDGETASEKFPDGNGSAISPYKISSPEDFKLFANLINSPETNEKYADKHYTLTADIDLEGYEWYPIGIGVHIPSPREEVGVYPFKGIFDGNGHTVSNYKITGTKKVTWYKYSIKKQGNYKIYTADGKPVYEPVLDADGNPSYDENGNPVYVSAKRTDYIAVGLFGYNSGTVKNLNVSGGEITSYSAESIAGLLCGMNSKEHKNIGIYNNLGEFTKTQTVDVASSGVIENCHVLSGTVNVTMPPSGSGTSGMGNFTLAGGAVGNNYYGRIYYSSANATVTAEGTKNDTYLGGFVGKNEGLNSPWAIVEHCSSTSDVSLNGGKGSQLTMVAGGFVGFLEGKVSFCYATGDVFCSGVSESIYSWAASGGFVGTGDRFSIYHCFAAGNVETNCPFNLTTSSNPNPDINLYSGSFQGNSAPSTFDRCFALGDASITADYPCNLETSYGSSALMGKVNNFYKYSTGYVSNDASFSINGTDGKSVNGSAADIYITADGGDMLFSDYFASELEKASPAEPFVYDESVVDRVYFDCGDYVIDTAGRCLDFAVPENGVIIVPYGAETIDAEALSVFGDDRVERILLPTTLDHAATIAEAYPDKALELGSTFSSKIDRTNVVLDGDFLIRNGSTIDLYIGKNEPTVLPKNAVQFALSSGKATAFSLASPSCILVNPTFNESYLTYAANQSIEFHIPIDRFDIYDYCIENSIDATLVGDLNDDGDITLIDLHLLKEVLTDALETPPCDSLTDIDADGRKSKDDMDVIVEILTEIV